MTEQPSPTLTFSEPPRSGIPAIEVQALMREFRQGTRAVDEIDLAKAMSATPTEIKPNA